MRIITTLIALLITLYTVAQPAPGSKQTKSILLYNATIHQGNGKKIDLGAIGFNNGIIDFVGSVNEVNQIAYQEKQDLKGAHIYPGFIAANSTLGLQEIGAVRATRDQSEVGDFNPHVRSAIAYNTDSEIIPTVRSNGVLMGQICPRSGTISGTSTVMQFDAWNWEDAIYREDDGIQLNWPRMYRWNWEKQSIEINENYDKQIREIKDFFAVALSYSVKSEVTDLKMDAMKGIFNGEKTLYLHTDEAREILHAIQLKKDLGVRNMVVVGGFNSWKVLDELKDNGIAVMLQNCHSLPSEDHHDVDQPFKTAAMLHEKGINFCFQNAGGMEQMDTRNLPFIAGTAVAYGLAYEAAVSALTLNVAMMLGIDKTTGSLETGKDATLFISTGDALDMRTNDVSLAFIQGRKIDLGNHQKELYEKYKKKYANQ